MRAWKAKLQKKTLFDEIKPYTTVHVETEAGGHDIKVSTSWRTDAPLEIELTETNLDILTTEPKTIHGVSELLAETPTVHYSSSRKGCYCRYHDGNRWRVKYMRIDKPDEPDSISP